VSGPGAVGHEDVLLGREAGGRLARAARVGAIIAVIVRQFKFVDAAGGRFALDRGAAPPQTGADRARRRLAARGERGEAMRKIVTLALLIACAGATSAAAQTRCKVMDPTGTPLNVRSAPQGPIVGVLTNGMLVSIVDSSVDAGGKSWAFVARYADGAPIGWVYREFIACY